MIVKLVAIFSITIAFFCLLLIPLWVMGVPGQNNPQNTYLEGWTMVLIIIALYPISIALIYSSSLIIWLLSLYNLFNNIDYMRFQQSIAVMAVVALIIAIIQMFRAFKMMFDR